MSVTVNTNVSALTAQRYLNNSTNGLNSSMEKLSSGSRINSAKDDAAGLQISNRLQKQMSGLNVAIRNANDGISIAQTAEGGMNETSSILNRMRDLSVQSANGNNTQADRDAIQEEVVSLQDELNRIAETTSFGGTKLLNGQFGTKAFQIGADSGESVNMTLTGVRADQMGTKGIETGQTFERNQELNGGKVNISYEKNGNVVNDSFDLKKGTLEEIATQLNGHNGGNFQASVKQSDDGTADTMQIIFDKDAELSFTGNGVTALGLAETDTAQGTQFEADEQSFEFDPSDEDENGAVTLSYERNGETVKDSFNLKSDDLQGIADQINAHNNNDFQVTVKHEKDEDGDDFARLQVVSAKGGDVSFSGNGAEAVGINSLDTVDSEEVAPKDLKLSVSDIDVSSVDGSQKAIGILDEALSFVDGERASLGATQNRLDHTISNLSNISENVAQSNSRIRDVDFAKETTEMTKSQILQQASTSILSQAKMAPQSALSLLG